MTSNQNARLPRWKNFEESARQASTRIFHSRTVTPNQRVMGSISETLRQIDIKVGDVELIDIECKNHSAPVDLPIVEQFANKLKDENANEGIIVSNSGFTESALKTAKHYNIKPVALIDRGHADTSNFILRAPVLAKGYYLNAISYSVSTSGIVQDFRFSPLVWDMKIADDSGRNIYELFRDHWNEGIIEVTQAGHYQYDFTKVPIIDLRGETIIVDLKYIYVVESEARKGSAGAESARGFFNLHDGSFVSSEDVIFEPILLDSIDSWPALAGDESLPEGTLQLQGIIPLPVEPPLSSYMSPITGKMLDPLKVRLGEYI